MKKINHTIALIAALLFAPHLSKAQQSDSRPSAQMENGAIAQESTTGEALNLGPLILIHTRLGDMKIRLYNDTPIHRDYMLNLIRKGYYNGSLFARVLYGFIIQGGSEDSKGAEPGQIVGYGRSSMLLPPEIRPNHIPKKGALAMPRQPDDVNPEKKTDASQIFIIQGRKYSKEELKTEEYLRNRVTKKKGMKRFYYPHKAEFDSLKHANPRAYNKKVRRLNQQIDSLIRLQPNHLLYTPEEKKAYTTVGGSPHLRGQYTILGEVVEGLEVIDRIATLEVDRNNRPLQDVVMTVKILQP